MKFLKNVNETTNVMPLNFIYHDTRNFMEDDAIDIVYKNIDTNEIIVETIEKPEIEVWIVKPEFRNRFNTSRDYIAKKYLDPYRVRYRTRYQEISKILDIDKDSVRACPWVLQSNIDIKTFYAVQFALEYSNDKPKKLNVGFFDIESDTINIDHFPGIGECPTNLISFVDASAKIAWLFILIPDGPSRTINPSTGELYDNRDQILYLQSHKEEFIQECHEMFDESYEGMTYEILFFTDEMKMTNTFFRLLEESNIDFAEAWNLPYDMGNLLGRPEKLCRDPAEICCSRKFKYKEARFIEDENPVAHKRKHICQFSHPTTFVDMLVIYAGIRSAGGKQDTLKLNAVAKKELKDEKLNYTEDGNIRTAAYENFKRFALYNLKDSLLLYALHLKNNDTADMYNRCIRNGLLPNEIFTTTAMLTNSITIDYFKKDLVVGNNRNKYRSSDIESFQSEIAGEMDGMDDNDDIAIDDIDDSDDDEEESPKRGKKKNFEGALVQDPNRQLSSGFLINGSPSTKVHAHLIDEDVTSLYPSLMIIMNLSNDTMIGKINLPYDVEDFFNRPENKGRYEFYNHSIVGDAAVVERAMEEYKFNRFPLQGYDFINEDQERYKINVSDTLAIMIAGKQWTEIGMNFCNLPTFTDLESKLKEIDANVFDEK